MPRIERPIFVISVGRSGSSMFHTMFCEHPNVAWFSGLANRYPTRMSLSRLLLRAVDYPVLKQCVRAACHPAENYEFWHYYAKGFSTPCRDIFREDVTIRTKKSVQLVLSELLTSKRSRLLLKITGWPRVGFIQEIFPDTKFIHIMRDGRAVVNSLINVDWWWGWRGPETWRWGQLTDAQREEWESHNRSFVALAAIEWKILMDAMEKAKTLVAPENFLEIRYEECCADQMRVFRDVVSFCELEWPRKFERFVRSSTLRNTNHKWRQELTREQQKILEAVLGDYLERYKYS